MCLQFTTDRFFGLPAASNYCFIQFSVLFIEQQSHSVFENESCGHIHRHAPDTYASRRRQVVGLESYTARLQSQTVVSSKSQIKFEITAKSEIPYLAYNMHSMECAQYHEDK